MDSTENDQQQLQDIDDGIYALAITPLVSSAISTPTLSRRAVISPETNNNDSNIDDDQISVISVADFSQRPHSNVSSVSQASSSIGQQVRQEMLLWTVETRPFGREPFQILVHPTDTIAEVKRLIDSQHFNGKLSPNKQILLYNHQTVGPDDLMVCEHEPNIPDKAQLRLMVNMQSGLNLLAAATATSTMKSTASTDKPRPVFHHGRSTRDISLQFLFHTKDLDQFFAITVTLRLPFKKDNNITNFAFNFPPSPPSWKPRQQRPDFVGILREPLTADSIAKQSSRFLGRHISPLQIMDLTWSEIIIDDYSSNDETAMVCCLTNGQAPPQINIKPSSPGSYSFAKTETHITATEQQNQLLVSHNRCQQCQRRISLSHASLKCKCCQKSFCNLHRYTDRHVCIIQRPPSARGIQGSSGSGDGKQLSRVLHFSKL